MSTTDSVLVESMVVGDDGITYVAGRFMGAIQFCDGSALVLRFDEGRTVWVVKE